MSIFGRFSKQERGAKAPEAKQPHKHARTDVAKLPKRELTVREEQERSAIKSVAKNTYATGIVASHVLLRPVVSEKSAHLHGMNQYVFKVAPDANKISIKKAIYEAYHAQPTSVKIIRTSGKYVMRGRTIGQRSSYKKAIVVMPKGVTLPIYESV